MKTRTVEVREGELLGPIEWSYDFLRHFDCYCGSPEQKIERCEFKKDILMMIEIDPTSWRVELAYGFTSRQVLAVGMYDGWPYWKPTPAVLTDGPIGSEWHFFYDLMGAKRIDNAQ